MTVKKVHTKHFRTVLSHASPTRGQQSCIM